MQQVTTGKVRLDAVGATRLRCAVNQHRVQARQFGRIIVTNRIVAHEQDFCRHTTGSSDDCFEELPIWLAPANLRSPTPRRHLAVQTILSGSGISTGCPSPTTFVLGLGPTNPERTSLPQETLGLRRVRFSLTLRYSCRHSHFRPLQPSSRSTFTADGTLPYHPPTGKPAGRSVASVPSLSPAEFSAQIHLTSELLRTLSMMAASEPTSWLSVRIHILYHLAWI